MRPLMLGVLLAFLPAERTADAAAYCYQGWVTGYSRVEHGRYTYDGTPISTNEAIVAAGWDIPIDSYVKVEGLPGRYRVADRGRLAPGQIDVAVWSRADAYAITGFREVCVTPPR